MVKLLTLPLIGAFFITIIFRIANGTDKQTVRIKAKAVEIINRNIFSDDTQKTKIIQHILRQGHGIKHFLIIERPSGYYHVTIYKVDEQYYYKLEEIYNVNNN